MYALLLSFAMSFRTGKLTNYNVSVNTFSRFIPIKLIAVLSIIWICEYLFSVSAAFALAAVMIFEQLSS